METALIYWIDIWAKAKIVGNLILETIAEKKEVKIIKTKISSIKIDIQFVFCWGVEERTWIMYLANVCCDVYCVCVYVLHACYAEMK